MYNQDITFSGLSDDLVARRRRRLLLLVVGLIVLLGAGIVAMLALAPDGRRPVAESPPNAGTDGLGGAPLGSGDGAPGSGQSAGPAETGEPGTGDQTDGSGGGGDGDGDGSDGGGAPEQPSGPCATATRALAGAPDPVQLKAGATKGSFTIHNCSDEAVAWLAATRPAVTLADEDGTLEPGATHVLSFTVDTSSFDTKTFTFKIKVYSTTSTFFYVDVNGSKVSLTAN